MENRQIINQNNVLRWLIKNSDWGTPMGLIYELGKRNSMAAEHIVNSFEKLSDKEQLEVLAEFARVQLQ